MKARPILFSGAMVRALLDGSKTQTRRLVKGTPLVWLEQEMFHPEFVADPMNHFCPYGEVGDLLWVRETWAQNRGVFVVEGCHPYIACKEGDGFNAVQHLAGMENAAWGMYGAPKWKPSIHMPRTANRLTLEIVGKRIERLKDIEEADAIAEGILKSDDHQTLYRHYDGDKTYAENGFGLQRTVWVQAVPSFESLWASINGQESWDVNPWVWVIEFKVHKQNIDDFMRERHAFA